MNLLPTSALLLFFCAAAISPSARAQSAHYVGSLACRPCHTANFESQSKTGHAKALSIAPAGNLGQWAFGAGMKATTWVSQVDRDTYVEHGMSYYPSIKGMALTPGHDTPQDVRYRTFDPKATTLRCFRCHSTGPISLGVNDSIQPSEPGIHCETCHGPGSEHVKSSGAVSLLNPGKLTAVELNTYCGTCHRKAPEGDWTDKWRTRHQPSYLNQAACFRKSSGKLSCLTCHSPHSPLVQQASAYDKTCTSCHPAVKHQAAIANRACADCHMPQVTINAQLQFTNHWIGIYSKASTLVPARSTAGASPPPIASSAPQWTSPADPLTLRPLFEQVLAEREKDSAPNDARTARAASDLGLFLETSGEPANAEPPLRRALEINRGNNSPTLPADQQNLARVLILQGKGQEAFELFQQAASGADPQISAESLASLAAIDSDHAEQYYRGALEAQKKVSGSGKQTAVLLNDLAMAIEARKDYTAAEPLFRQALVIQEKLLGLKDPAIASTLSNLGSLLESVGKLDEAEQMERRAVRIFEEKLGPFSAELATSCTNLADVLWVKHDRVAAASLYERAISIDESVYGPGNPEVAGDLVNYATLLNESRQPGKARPLLQRALAIYEKTLGPGSPQAIQTRHDLDSNSQ